MPQLAFFYSQQFAPQTTQPKTNTPPNPYSSSIGTELSSSSFSSTTSSSSPPPHFYYMMDPFNKRQRRKAAGNLVSGLFGVGIAAGNTLEQQQPHKKPSTAQPRPSIHIPPRGIGPIYDPNENDVLSGRGGRINAHAGNVQFRAMVAMRKKEYLAKTTKKLQKAHIAADIVKQIRNMQPPGRFLKEDPDGAWYDIGDQKAIKKVGQALREDAPDIRTDLNDDEDGGQDDNNNINDNASEPNNSSGDEDEEEGERPNNTTSTIAVVSDVASRMPTAGGSGGTTVAVSARGAKSGGISPTNPTTTTATARKHSYEPLAVIQDIPTAPSSDNHNATAFHPHAVMPSSKPSFGKKKSSSGGVGGGSASVSGAAAAALNEMPDDVPPFAYDTAFGRPFHPPPPSAIAGGAGTGGSMISGISGLTDPMSALSGEMGLMPPPPPQQQQQLLNYHQQNALRSSQLQHLRQLWLNQQHQQQHDDLAGVAMPMSQLAASPPHHQQQQHDESSPSHPQVATRQFSGSFSMASSSLQRSQSWHDVYNGGKDDFTEVMSWTEHSLMGGGIGARGDAGSMASENSASGYYQQQQQQQGPSRSHQYRQSNNYGYPMDSGMSTTSMSLLSGMGSLPSIMSDISENLMALDLAEPKMTNFFQ